MKQKSGGKPAFPTCEIPKLFPSFLSLKGFQGEAVTEGLGNLTGREGGFTPALLLHSRIQPCD